MNISINLDLRDGRLWLDGHPVELRPKTWQLAQYMVARPGQLLSKQELLEAVWGGVIVTDSSLSQAIREIRNALGDNARSPKFIETVHRRGFRFLLASTESDQTGMSGAITPIQQVDRHRLFGRTQELNQLGSWLKQARDGNRQIVFITGEPGIGKTSLVHAFLERISAQESDTTLIGSGQCIDQHGVGEAYLPILEAIDRLARSPNGELVKRMLKRYAPTWLVQLPWLLESDQAIDRQLIAVTPARMLREFCLFVEALTDETPLILWLEDMHWSDNLTVSLVDALSRRVEPARLMVVASYRPAGTQGKVLRSLNQSLLVRDVGTELALEPLDEAAVTEYLGVRFPKLEQAGVLSDLIYQQTDGNPLFVVTLIDYLIANKLLALGVDGWGPTVSLETLRAESPKSLKDVFELQLEHVSDEEMILFEAASVIGTSFDTQSLTGAIELKIDVVEAICGRLAGRGHILRMTGTTCWPDASVGQSYQFVHDVYRRVIYDSLAPSRRQRLHLNIATWLLDGHISEQTELAAELALHFELGGEPERAIEFLILAAERSEHRSASRETVAYLEHALGQFATLPKTHKYERMELGVLMRIMRAVIGAVAYTATEQDHHIARALELCHRLNDKSNQLVILSYQSASVILQGDMDTARGVIKTAVNLARTVSDPVLLSYEPLSTGVVSLTCGALEDAENSFKRSIDLLDDADLRQPATVFGHDPAVLALGYSAQGAWLRGFPDEANRRVARCRIRAEAIGAAQVVANALDLTLSIAHLRGDLNGTRACIQSFDACLEKFGVQYPYMRPLAARNWLLIQDDAAALAVVGFTKGLREAKEARAGLYSSLVHTTLAEAHLSCGSTQLGFEAIDEALRFVQMGERVWEAETYRIKGELHHREGSNESARDCFMKALDVAKSQGALSLELRAVTSLAALMEGKRRRAEARVLLTSVLERFEEGFDTSDLLLAAAMLKKL
jgi:DNA-binding winged helix-turn-helix (wHTH) protein/tetratricopeptide (TPR) repeat protein